jgi:hypothetical protein
MRARHTGNMTEGAIAKKLLDLVVIKWCRKFRIRVGLFADRLP